MPHPCRLAALLALASAQAFGAAEGEPMQMAEVEFNPQFLVNRGAPVDLARYNRGNVAAPGTYRADLSVNGMQLGSVQVTLKPVGARHGNALPCFDRELLERAGVDLNAVDARAGGAIPAAAPGRETPQACAPVDAWVPGATAAFDTGEQRLDVTVPQAAMKRQPRGYIDPRYWTDGVPAGLLQYNANYFRSDQQGHAVSQGYLGLSGGLNAGPWRLRHSGNLTTGSAADSRYRSVQTNVQRAIRSMGSQLVMGDAYTDGALFDSFGFRGVQLSTDDRMLPQSQRGYAPRVTGIARSNAVVRVRQNGSVIYETNVAPGAFVIDDLYPMGYGGELIVEVTEADGSVHQASVPYAAAVNALRPGVTRYGLVAGAYRDPLMRGGRPYVMQATLQHGFTNMLTGYGGVIASRDYAAGMAGVALNLEWGAVGLDATQSRAELGAQGKRSGHSVRLSYSKLIAPTDTNITVAAYRYSSRGYLDLRDAMSLRHGDRDARRDSVDSLSGGNPTGGFLRGRLQLTVNQQLPSGWGSFYLSGSSQDYWNRPGRDTQFQAGYSTSIGRVSAGLSLARQYDASSQRWDNVAMLNIGIPIGSGARQLYASTNVQNNFRGRTDVQQSVTGATGEDGALTYGVNASRSLGGAAASSVAGGSAAYASPYATMAANASGGRGFSQYGATVSGGVVAYGGGVVFTPALGDTAVVVEARHAAGARVASGSGLRIDPWGRAVVSNLTPFASNEIEVDPKGLPLSVALKSTIQHVAPTAGAVVPVTFETEGGGQAVLVRARLPGGDPVPFGARVVDTAGDDVGTVAQAGRLLLRNAAAGASTYRVVWAQGEGGQCRLAVTLPATPPAPAARMWTAVDSRCE
ncbi:fimbria/pilus outer membrane usher protein [Achromobacter insuavis]|uniref:fimbria/pilus outer membrane usher protein n=1 Tax=Achromobacter insuavis TaxID=1287735 RepID=UPI003B9D057F